MKRLTAGIATTFIVVFGMLAADAAHAKDKISLYEVTVTNITRGQIISPPMVISHNRHFELFRLGDPASPGLAALAEDADATILANELDASEFVYDFNNEGGPIKPGLSAKIEITTRRGFERISVAGMLVTTNDAFFAVRGANVRSKDDVAVDARAYDAGSEVNTEQCDYIPGPPCGNGGVRDTEGAEGYVYIHSGIHDIGDLDPAEFDWRNPVATIMVQRVK